MRAVKKTYGIYEPVTFTAWVILPPGMDRERFIKKCYQTGTVLVKSVDNQIEINVQVDRGSIHLLRFPANLGEKGSAVSCLKDQIYRTTKVVAILQDEDEDQLIFEENQFRVHKRNGDNFVDLDIKGNTGDFDLTADSSGYEDVESSINFLNKKGKAKLKLFTQGVITVIADDSLNFQTEKEFNLLIQDNDDDTSKPTTLNYKAGIGLNFTDEFGNIVTTTKNGIKIKTKNGEQFILDKSGLTIKTAQEDLKKILSDTLKELISAIITTPSGAGALAPTTVAKLEAISLRLNTLFA